eukprot:TRINITY_DN24992_c0_g2_i1.p1 TRINITY_DN24992_c0_g2~~TRINITY_DN24992_c0_g2_i1.p1  ORF type:complete len:228 (-),score=46.90 TRINITY_DN24992_c0_g2_i1:35-718(-)
MDDVEEGRPRRQVRALGETLVVGLTGSIGMGKSTVSGWLRDFGASVYDADTTVHRLYAAGGAAVEPVRQLFGDGVLGPEGGIDRQALGKHVIGPENGENMQRLEAVVFPLVDEACSSAIANANETGEPVLFLDIPLLMEREGEYACDLVVVVSCPAEVQRERVLARPGMSEAKFEGILARQVPDKAKRARADEVVDTGVAMEVTRAAIEALVTSYRNQIAEERRSLG